MELTQADKFSKVMCELCDNVSAMVGDMYELGHKRIHPNLLNAIKAYLLDKNIDTIMGKFIEGSVGFWDQMRNHKEEFFVNNVSKVFGDLPYPKEIKEFSNLFLLREPDGSRLLIEEDRELIWEHFDSMISICIVDIHQQRHPSIKKVEGKGKAVYTRSFYPEIKLAEQARLWKVKLEW